MGRTFRKQKRNQRGREDDWGGVKPKSGKGHKANRARVKQALRMGDDPEEFE
jgi:ribosomal protein L15